MDLYILLCAILSWLPAVAGIVWFYIWIGPSAVLRLGRSKSGYKKLKQSLTLCQKIFKITYIKQSKAAIGYQYFFVIMTYIGYSLLVIFLLIFLFSLAGYDLTSAIRLFILLKGYIIELPALIFILCNIRFTKDKRGGEWKFTVDYRNKHKNN